MNAGDVLVLRVEDDELRITTLAEVQSKLVDRGIRPDDARVAALSSIRESVVFDEE